MKTELSVSSLKQAKLEGADPGFPGAQETAAGQISAGDELSGRAGDAVAFTAAPLSEPVGPADASSEALAGSLLYAKEVQGAAVSARRPEPRGTLQGPDPKLPGASESAMSTYGR